MHSTRWLTVFAWTFALAAIPTAACSSSSDDGSPSNAPDSSTGRDVTAGGDGPITTTDGASIFDAGVDPYKKLPCTVSLGTGSGTFDTSSVASNPGDVICLKAGSYSGGTIQNLNDRIIQNDGGQVVITGVVSVGNLVDVTFSGSGDDVIPYGFQLNGSAASMVITGANTNLLVHDFESLNAGIFLDAGHTGLIWSGGDGGNQTDDAGNAGFVLYKSHLDRIHLKTSDELLQGNYGALNLFVNFMSDVEMSNIFVENSSSQGQQVVSGGGMFNLNVHDWTITGMNDVVVGSLDDRDCGNFTIVGNGSFKRMHRVGGWGWLVRTFGASLGPTPGEYHCENNVDLSTEYYGTCEVRNDDSPSYLIPGIISTVNIFISNNVSAHKGDIKGGYTDAIALIPHLIAGTTATLTNNHSCMNADDYGDKDALHFFEIDDGGTVINTNNTQNDTSCAGLTDPITGLPL